MVAAAVVLVICIVAFSANGTQTVTDGTISLEVPADWTVEENSDDGYFDIASEDETIHMMLATYALTDYFTETELSSVSYLASAYGESEVADIFAIALIDALGDASVSVDESSYESSTTDDEVYLYTFEASFYDDEDVEYTGSFELILTGEYASFIAAFNSPDASDDDIVSMEEALESVTILNPSKPIFLDAEEDGEDDDTEDAEEEEEEETQTVSDGTLSIEIPADWEIVDSDSDTIVVRTASGEVIVDFVSAALDGSYSADAIASGVIEGATSDGTMTIDEDSLEEETTDDGVLIRSYDASLSYDGYEYEGTVVMFFSGDSYSVLNGLCLTDLLDEYGDELDEVMTSATVLDPSEPNLLSTTADEDIDEEEETDIESEEVEAEEEEETSEEETAEKLSLEIIDSGYYVTEDGDVYFGICVYNPNATYEIDSPKLTITGKDADGVITFTYTTYLDSLLPNEVQYVGDYVFGEAGTVTVEFSVPVLSDYKYEVSAETSVDCFTLSNINYVEGSYHDSITGEITTDIQLDDVTEARISVIFYDEDGNIVGGDYTYTDIAVEGSTMAFEISLDDELPDYATYEIYAYPQR